MIDMGDKNVINGNEIDRRLAEILKKNQSERLDLSQGSALPLYDCQHFEKFLDPDDDPDHPHNLTNQKPLIT